MFISNTFNDVNMKNYSFLTLKLFIPFLYIAIELYANNTMSVSLYRFNKNLFYVARKQRMIQKESSIIKKKRGLSVNISNVHTISERQMTSRRGNVSFVALWRTTNPFIERFTHAPTKSTACDNSMLCKGFMIVGFM